MQSERNNLSERLLDFGVNAIKLARRLNKTATGRHIAGQLTRSGTSAGANYEEACGAESRLDFIHKLQVSLKELRESSVLVTFNQKGESYAGCRPGTYNTFKRGCGTD